MGGYAEDDETKTSAAHPDGDAIAAIWNAHSTVITGIGHKVVALQTGGDGKFDGDLKGSLFRIAQSCTDVGLRLTAAADQATAQAVSDKVHNTRLATDTKALTNAKNAVSALEAATTAYPNNTSITNALPGARAAEAEARATRTSGLSEWNGQATGNTQSLPGHGTEVQAAAQRAVSAQVQAGSGVTTPQSPGTPSNTPQVPAGNGGGSPSKTANPAKTEKPAKTPEDKKSGDEGKTNDPSKTTGTPQQQQNQQGQGQQQPQGGQQQPGAGGQPAAGQPQAGKGGVGAVPISTPTPVPAGRPDTGKGGSGPKPAPTLPPRAVSPTGPLGTGTRAGSPLGTGGSAAPSGAGGGRGGAAGAGLPGSSSATQRGPMSGMPMGAGAHGGGAGGTGGSARPKGEIKSDDPTLTGKRTEDEATGGVADEGVEAPRGPDNPASGNGSASAVSTDVPTPPSPPSPPAPPRA